MGGFLGGNRGPDRLERVAQMLASGCCGVEVSGDEAVEPSDVQRIAAEFLELHRRAALDASGPRRTSLLDFLGAGDDRRDRHFDHRHVYHIHSTGAPLGVLGASEAVSEFQYGLEQRRNRCRAMAGHVGLAAQRFFRGYSPSIRALRN